MSPTVPLRWLTGLRSSFRSIVRHCLDDAGPKPRRRRFCRLFVEPLEDRTLLSASIFGSIWHDLNIDGVRAGEPGLVGITVYQDDGSHAFNGSQPHTLTNGSGDYSFTGLAPGSYTIAIALPPGGTLTSPSGAPRQDVVLGNQDQSGVDFGVTISPSAPANTDVTADGAVQQTPSVAVNPLDPSHVVMAYMDYAQGNGYAGIGVAVSHNGGAAWQNSTIALPSGFDQAANMPVVRFDSAGHVFVSFQAVKFLGKDSNGFALKPNLVDDSSQQFVNYLNKSVSQRAFGMQANNGIFVVESTDDGTHWGAANAVSSQRYDQTATTSPAAVTAGSGRVVTPVVMPSNMYTGKVLIIDEGQASMERVQVTAFNLSAGTFTATFANPHTSGFTISVPVVFDTLPDFAIDTTSGKMYATWTRFYPASQFPGRALIGGALGLGGSEVMFAVSTNGGQTWVPQLQPVISSVTVNTQGSGYSSSSPPTVTFSPPPGGGTTATGTAVITGDKVTGVTITNPGNGYVTAPTITISGAVGSGAVATANLSIFKMSIIRDPLTGGTGGSSATAVEGTGTNAFSRVTVGPDGAVYVSQFGGGRFPVFYSSSGGTAFRLPDPGTGAVTMAPGYPFGLDSNEYTGIYPSGASVASFGPSATPSTPALVTNNNFRTFATRAIAADPTRPGRVYAVEAVQILTTAGTVIDPGEITFSWSDDFGVTWHNRFTVGGNAGNLNELAANLQFRYRSALNDDDASRFLGFDTTPQDEVISAQSLPQLSVDAQGNIGVIWYDTRRDPTNHRLDVYGTFSNDGGLTWSPNNRITSTNFDASTGEFTPNFLGDRIGLALAGGNAYAAWTGTTGTPGNQDIYFSQFALAQAPFNDRYEANDDPVSATDLGKVTAQRLVPRLGLSQGDQDWFKVEAGATGNLLIAATAPVGASTLQIELWDSTGTTRVATGTAVVDNGVVVGQQIRFQSNAGEKYLVKVTGAAPTYSMSLQNLTADLGTQVQTGVDATLAAGGADIYRVVAGVGGSLKVSLTSGGNVQGNINVQVLSANGQTILAQGTEPGTPGPGEVEQLTLPVAQGQEVLVKVVAQTTATVLLNGNAVSLGLGTPGPATNFSTPAAVSGVRSIKLQATGPNPVKVKITQKNSTGGVIGAQDVTLQPGAAATAVNLNNVAGSYDIQAMDPLGSGDYHLSLTNFDVFQSAQNSIFYPVGGSSSSIAVDDVNGDLIPDLVLTSTQGGDQVRVLLGNQDGTFQAAREFAVGSGQAAISAREAVVADFNQDNVPDIVVPNYFSADVSVLLGHSDGTFDPQRRFDSVFKANSIAVGDFNGDGKNDLAVVDRNPGAARVAILLGNGDGTFQPPQIVNVPFVRGDASPIRAGDINGDHNTDLVVFSLNDGQVQVLLGDGHGNFALGGNFSTGEVVFDGQLADLNGDGRLDVVAGGGNTGSVIVLPADGHGGFGPAQVYATAPRLGSDNVVVVGLTVADYGRDGGGAADGRDDVIVTTRYRAGSALPAMYLLPGIAPDAQGHVLGAAIKLGTAREAGKVAVADFNGDGTKDLAVTQSDGVQVAYGQPPAFPPNNTQGAARDLGTVVHYQGPKQSIVAGFQDAWYKLTVPTETDPNAGDQVLDFSALFENVQGAGLRMEVTDQQGNVLGTGARFRVVAAQGQQLFVHVFGQPAHGATAQGAGAYTLDIDVLPQVLSVRAESALPGGPATCLIITLQGDRLDPTSARDVRNYTVTWLGADGLPGTADDQVITPTANVGGQPVAYNPSSNVDVTTGRSFSTAVRQTITLLFNRPLPTGSYTVELSDAIKAAPLNAAEADLLADRANFGEHPLVSRGSGQVQAGAKLAAPNLVPASGPGNLNAITNGTTFLAQFHDNMGAALDSLLNSLGDDPAITGMINQRIVDWFGPGLAAGDTSVAVLWLDPVSIDLADSQGARTVHSLQTNASSNTLAQTFTQTAGNVQVMVMAGLSGTFSLNIANVSATARGGAVVFAAGVPAAQSLTQAIRDGTRSFSIDIPQSGVPGLGTATASTTGVPGATTPSASTAATTSLSASSLVTAFVLVSAGMLRPGSIQLTVGNPTGASGTAGTAPASTSAQAVAAVGVGGEPPAEGDQAVAERQFQLLLQRSFQEWLAASLRMLGGPAASLVGVFRALLRVMQPVAPRGAAKPAGNPRAALPANGADEPVLLVPVLFVPEEQLADAPTDPAELPSIEAPVLEIQPGQRAEAIAILPWLGVAVFAAGLCRPRRGDEDEDRDRDEDDTRICL